MNIELDESDKKEILRYLGYRGTELPSRIEGDLLRAMDLTNEMIRPGAVWKLFNLEYSEDGIVLAGTSCILKGESIRKHLKEADRCALLCVTLGRDFDEEVERLMVKNPGLGVIVNACGIQAVEKLADALQLEINERLAPQKTGVRFSPGYGDLPLETQGDFIRILNTEKTVGVRLNENYLMNPMKSVTAICGII
ncbi:MAG: hypothetical protein K5796_04785 [Lachnospiraceae bacterium]|nr:hypothetical protein [Lachnospiraceae bacterium]